MREDRALDLTKGSIIGNLVKLSLPIMLSNFMQTFYNLTDAWWLGKLGDSAKGAVATAGLTFPIVFFLTSFGFGFVVAGTAMVARFKGAGQQEKIKETIGQFVFVLIIFTAIFLLISIFLVTPILKILQVPQEIFTIAYSYLRIILTGMIFMFIFVSYQSIAHGLGDTFTPMIIQIVSVSLNVVLDPMFIFGVGFFPRLETAGAAWATLISRIVAAGMAFYFMAKNSPHLIPSFREILPKAKPLKNMLKLAIPASIGQSMTSFGFVFLQGFVNSFGTTVISIFSIGNRMTGLFMMPAMGISNALSSIVGQNLGAGNIQRAKQSLHRAMLLVLAIMGLGCGTVFFFGAELTKFFINDAEVISIGIRMFRVSATAAFIFSIFFVFIGVYNGAGHTRSTMILNVVRLWGIRIPMVYVLSGTLLGYTFWQGSVLAPLLQTLAAPLAEYPYDSLWWSMLISNTITSTFAAIEYFRGKWQHVKID